MALPILNETPSYSMEIPSTGKKFKYRPYLVKEEKILLLANETKDREQIINAIADTISACTFGKVNVRDLTTFDLTYIFLKMRAKSVGETVTLQLPCGKCETRNEYTMNLDHIECPVGDRSLMIDITDDIKVEMKYPNYTFTDIEQEQEGTFHLMANCIKAVITEEDRIDVNDEPIESIRAFLESMTREQFGYLTSFIKGLPTVEYTIDFHCHNCNEHNEIALKGIDNFF